LAPLTTIAVKWRKEMTQGYGEMKLKTEDIGSQKVLTSWMQQLREALRAPILEKPNQNTKMECVCLATEFLPEMLRWTLSGQEGESLRLHWPERPIKMIIEVESIVMPDGEKQKKNGGVEEIAELRRKHKKELNETWLSFKTAFALKNREMAEVSTMIRSIFVKLLGKGYVRSALSIIADITKRAPLRDIPSDIYQIGLTCFVELVECLMKLNANPSTTLKGPFTTIASKWRKDIAGNGEMRKLKNDNLGYQKEIYNWIRQLGTALLAPLLEEPVLSMKMNCVFLAAEYLHELLRWAATADEPIRLYAPNKPIKMKIEDDAIVVREEVPRGRNSSVVSTRSTLTAKEDGKKQTKKGDV
ncbi:hypothetical protein PENTCL1PPCAC_1524, partial [Pristionchus entomophagus]